MRSRLKTLDSILIALLNHFLITLQAIRTDRPKTDRANSCLKCVKQWVQHRHKAITLSVFGKAENVLVVKDNDTYRSLDSSKTKKETLYPF